MSIITDKITTFRVAGRATTLVRVLVAGRQPIVRAGIRAELEAAPGMATVGEATTNEQVLRQVARLEPDVLILDVHVPDIKLYVLLTRLRALPAPPAVLILAGEQDVEYAAAALRAGAAGYLFKDEDTQAIVAGVRAAARGEMPVSERLMDDLVNHSAGRANQLVPALTRREMDVLQLVAQGSYNARIASALGISEGTVKNCVTRLYDKFQVHSRAELVAYAWRNRLVG